MINAEITLKRDDLIKRNGKIAPPHFEVELSATQQKLLNEYLIEIIVTNNVSITDEKS